MSNSAQAAWSSAFGFMLFIAVGGNAIVMWIVIAHRRMRTVTNYFLVNLSLADLLMSVLNCLFNFIYMLKSDWIFGDWYCTINNFIANVTVAASIFTLTGISFDRYMAIVRPLEPRMSKKCSLLAIAAIWFAGMILGIPCLMYSSTVVYNEKYHLTACILVWPDGSSDVSKMDYIYQVVLFIVTYLMPIAGMSRCYWAMGRELWGSRSIGEHTQRQADAICRKRKVVRMFAAVVGIFAVCWLPYQLYFVYMHVDKSLMYWPYTQQMYLSFYWLAMGNAMVNPIIYYWMNNR
ncbi:tachykinin-like peptides receptor 86C [Ctenocephalides felis]|uniref:tachykinin-like peptides receptor 86C n=1 Tax=Ctenocephalides felis TaxID=7515 RepID=UPI000E6E28A3|nr:tachykinin-like peptides receptor 86C [Ctenocephalides felis]